MAKKNMTKTEKIFTLVSVVWLIVMYAIFMTSYTKDTAAFLIVGVLPVVIGWGINFIRKK
tara:strand:+ start:168 stop:347 length:180 start_codon:yes stop_codon:yes gene_type:complete